MVGIVFLVSLFTIFYVCPSAGHASIWHPSMWGFNVTDKTFGYDNRPVSPLAYYTFEQWWFHGHLDHPPNPGDIFELPAGKAATTEIACNKGATSYFASSEGGDIRSGDDPCPNRPSTEYHTNGPDDLKGCSLAIAYKSDVNQVQPEDFTVFSVNQTCVYHRFTDFQVPERMPPCPEGGCICAWFWIHSQDSGGEQNYMNGFKCNITGSTSNVALATPQLARRCGADSENGKPEASPGNCTYGAKQPFYWFQQERNNMFEGTYSPPFYLDLYNFKDGAQDDIFEDSYPGGLPPPSPNSTVVPTPFLGGSALPGPTGTTTPSPSSVASSSTPTPSTSAAQNVSGSISLSSSAVSASVSPVTSSDKPATVSTATVISFVTVTSTATAASSPLAVSSNSRASATLYSTQFVTVTATPAGGVAATNAPLSVATLGVSSVSAVSTIFLNNPAAVPTSSVLNGSETSTRQFAALERVDGALLATSSVSALPTVAGGPRLQMCKRSSFSGSVNRRGSSSLTSFTVTGVRNHRRMQKRSSLWNIL
ncbi:unnamed protein product [Somion occarium]|uniref:Uncharacterized protein n=2 Tax=Somion occarium TaxID=3059160 RepID=A0ABP1E833_9APHY